MFENNMNSERITDEEWLENTYIKSESTRTKRVAQTSLNVFDLYCQNQGLKQDKDEMYGYIPAMIEKYQKWYRPSKDEHGDKPEPDIRSICVSLSKFVQFMNKDQDIVFTQRVTQGNFKKKSPKTIKLYFSFIKSYLRQCHSIKLSTEDIKDFVQFPKTRKDPRQPLSIEQLKLIMNNAGARRKALYYVLISSGMRLGEALTLKKKDFHMDENPMRISIDANNTKTREGRDTFISSEAVEKVKYLLDGLQADDMVFAQHKDVHASVILEDQIFGNLREKLGLTERYANSVRFVVQIHAFRSYFMTKAAQKHGESYSHALSGHSAYLKQYIRIPKEEQAKLYLDLEPELLIESRKLETEKVNAKLMIDMQEQMIKMQDEIERLQKYPQTGLVIQ